MFWTSAPFGSYRRVYRCTVCFCMLVLLAACNGKHVAVSHLTRANPSARASELEGLASCRAMRVMKRRAPM